MNKIRIILIFLNNRRIRYLLAGKIRRIKKSLRTHSYDDQKPGAEIRKQHSQLWKDFSGNINYDWLEVYTAVSGRSDYRYVPEDIYYTEIEPRLNNRLYSKAWTDKNHCEIFLAGKAKMPEVMLRCINGLLYSRDFRPAGRPENYTSFPPSLNGRRLVIKPTMDSGGGRSVRVILCTESGIELMPPVEGIETVSQLFRLYGSNFIIQDYINQHAYFACFNESSLNTIRVLTYRSIKDEKVVVLHRLLRAGRPGSVVDNQASGGIACAINTDGRLMSFGVDKSGRHHKGTATVDFSSSEAVPFMKEIDEIAIEVASVYRYSRLLGLDFAVSDKGEVILIEVNDSNNEINFFQMSSGPLFGPYTEEVASSCKKLPRSFVIDYII